MSQKMQAIIMTQTGGPEVLQPAEVDIPACAADEVLVRLKAAGINPVDTKLRTNGLYFGSPPAILGCDGAGIIEAAGPEASGYQPGDAVYYCYGGLGQKSGNYAQYAAVPASYLAHKPRGLDFAAAAAAPLVLITAWESLFDRAHIHSGQKVFIHGGAGGVGHVAIQLAKIAGCEVATTVGSEEKAGFVRELGADLSINYKKQDVARELLDWTNGQGVDVAFDTVGGAAFTELIPAVRVYGDLVTILQIPSDTDFKTLRLRNIRITQELMLTPMILGLKDGAEHHGAILEQCAQLFDENRLSIHLDEVFPLLQAAEAHRRLEKGEVTGKLALSIP